MSFSFFMHVGFAGILRQLKIFEQYQMIECKNMTPKNPMSVWQKFDVPGICSKLPNVKKNFSKAKYYCVSAFCSILSKLIFHTYVIEKFVELFRYTFSLARPNHGERNNQVPLNLSKSGIELKFPVTFQHKKCRRQ